MPACSSRPSAEASSATRGSKPSFYGSWFPFPDNRALDWEKYGKADFLYVSHRHRDHFDPWLLETYVPKDIEVLLPDYPTDDLENDLRSARLRQHHLHAGGRGRSSAARSGSWSRRCARRATGPIGDSSLSIDDGTASILNQNDSHPLDLEKLLSFAKPEAYFTQFSGAIWWPMVYDLAGRGQAELRPPQARGAAQARDVLHREGRRPARVPDGGAADVPARRALPLQRRSGSENDSIFTDQAQFIARMQRARRREYTGHVFIPGTVVEIERRRADGRRRRCTRMPRSRRCSPTSGGTSRAARHAGSRRSPTRRRPAPPVLPPEEMLAALKEWWEPLLRRGRIFREGVGGPVRYTIGDLDMVVDFPKAKLREYAGEETGYWFTIPADLVSTNIRDREIDWSNSIFLSMQFQAGRVGKFNEFIYTFMKCLSRDRIEYVENWYAEQSDVSEDVQLGDWVVQRRCPHLRADLSKTAQDRGRRPHVQPARLEVGPRQRPLPDHARAPDPLAHGRGRAEPRGGAARRLTPRRWRENRSSVRHSVRRGGSRSPDRFSASGEPR